MNFSIPLRPAAGRPAIIARARERLEETLEHKPLRLLELYGAELLPGWQRRRMVAQREDFREVQGKVIGAMLEHADVVTARVGAPRSDGHVTPPGQQGTKGHEAEGGLRRDTGCSIQQIRRVIRAYERAGYLRGPRLGSDGHYLPGPSGRRYQRVQEYVDDAGVTRYRGHRVVYVFTDKFFERLRLGTDWALARKQAVARQAEGRARLYPGALLAARDGVRGVRHGSRETRPYGAPGAPTRAIGAAASTAPTPSIDATENAARLVQVLMHGLRNKHPEWGLPRIRAEAEALARSGRLR